jgi:hypothetical protein
MTTFRRYSGRFLESKGSFTFAKRPAIATWMYLPWLIELYMFQFILSALQTGVVQCLSNCQQQFKKIGKSN